MTKVLKVCVSEWESQSRDKRELSVCKDLGMQICVLSKGEKKEDFIQDGVHIYKQSPRPFGRIVPNSINRFISLFKWAGFARHLHPDIISGHDLPGLLIGYLSTVFIRKKKGPYLVYDSHEFELGRYANRSRFSYFYTKVIEGFLMRRCSFTLMVNDEIADRVQQIYQLNKRPIVARNTPFFWKIDEKTTKDMHDVFCKELGVSSNSFIVMYHGVVIRGRGVETLISVVEMNPKLYGVVLGNGDEGYMEELHRMVINKGVADRILFKSAVPASELWKFVGASDLGLIMIDASCENHYLCLPNKFFENIQSETPIVCPNYPAMKGVVDRYNNGITCDVSNVYAVNQAIEELRQNPSLYEQKKEGARRAKNDLCWEVEKEALKKAYLELIR